EGKVAAGKLTETQGKLAVLDDALRTIAAQIAPLVAERDALAAAERQAVERDATLQRLAELADVGKKYHTELLAARAEILRAVRKGVQRYEAARVALEDARRAFALAADQVQRGVIDRRHGTTSDE